MTCSAGDLLTSWEAAHPAACSLEASRIKHKSAGPQGQWEGRWEGKRDTEEGMARSVPLLQAYTHFLRGFWKRTRTGNETGS